MSNTAKDKIANAGHAAIDAAKKVGHKIAEDAEKAVDFVKEKIGIGPAEASDARLAGIKERMSVIASCGKKVGVVDHVESGAIKLTKNDSPDGKHHFIPAGWIARVDGCVHLTKDSQEAERDWKSDAASCGCGSLSAN